MTDAALANALSLNGKTALIIGAASGIGKGIAEVFQAAGARIIAADINTPAETARPAKASADALSLKVDLAEAASVRALFAEVATHVPSIDVLVNCAGIYPNHAFTTVSPEIFDRVMNVNARGVFLSVQEALKLMQARGGSIVNISSTGAIHTGVFGMSHYTMSKAAVNGLTIAMALELAEFNIRVNAVMPGAVATARAQEMLSTGQQFRGPHLQEGRIPLTGQAGRPEDIAYACLYFASDASRYVTGQLLAVDGGFLIS
jgi:NAD(P)-dependent dehydrogenase (short-subunit alcohol dehydrogenase family)